ncbi:MAG: ABC transporter ATP-binding protein [Nitrospirales bacterium]
MSSTVVLQDVRKTHGQVVAVDGVSLSIGSGEFFSILGPSGSGKSTLLRLIAGLDSPDSGTITIQQRIVNADPPHIRPVNMVFQQYALFPHMTVFENIAFGLKMRRQAETAIRLAVGQMATLVRLEAKLQRLPAQLSGGEQQRVALARALVNRPIVLLLDEPMAALDQQLREEMHTELKRIQREVKATFICVTHQQDEALMLSDRIGVMVAGKLLQVGTPQEIYEQPVSSTVAKFIGLSNSLSGTITRVENGVCWIEQENFPPMVAHCPRGLEPGPALVLVRPERLHISIERSHPEYENTLPAVVHHIAFRGNEVFYQFRLTNEALWTGRVPIVEAQSTPLSIGQMVYLQWATHEGFALSH